MLKAQLDNQEYEVDIDKQGITIDGEQLDWDIQHIENQLFHIIHNDQSYRTEILEVDKVAKEVKIKINGKKVTVSIKDKMDLLLEKLGMDMASSSMLNDIKAPMPGLILEINVNIGDEVQKGDPIMILEAMKMENVLKSPGEGTIKNIKVSKGDSVEKNQVLVEF